MSETKEREGYVSSDPKKDFDRFKQALSAIVKIKKRDLEQCVENPRQPKAVEKPLR